MGTHNQKERKNLKCINDFSTDEMLYEVEKTPQSNADTLRKGNNLQRKCGRSAKQSWAPTQTIIIGHGKNAGPGKKAKKRCCGRKPLSGFAPTEKYEKRIKLRFI